MLAQVERLGRLVQQLLDLSRLEAGVVPLAREEFRVEPLLEHAVREQQLHAPSVDVAVTVEPKDLTADGDPERVHQVVANLLENAVRFTPTGGVVEVRARRGDHNVTIEVLDEGPGIPDAERTRVFERFYRADAARSSTDGGAGLGLAIARWIVDLHGGEIHPERREPHGCRMVVTLPRDDAARPELEPATSPRNGAPKAPSPAP
jgi:signal transduction histidine kinase